MENLIEIKSLPSKALNSYQKRLSWYVSDCCPGQIEMSNVFEIFGNIGGHQITPTASRLHQFGYLFERLPFQVLPNLTVDHNRLVRRLPDPISSSRAAVLISIVFGV